MPSEGKALQPGDDKGGKDRPARQPQDFLPRGSGFVNFLTIFKFADDNPDFLCIIVEKKMFFFKDSWQQARCPRALAGRSTADQRKEVREWQRLILEAMA